MFTAPNDPEDNVALPEPSYAPPLRNSRNHMSYAVPLRVPHSLVIEDDIDDHSTALTQGHAAAFQSEIQFTLSPEPQTPYRRKTITNYDNPYSLELRPPPC